MPCRRPTVGGCGGIGCRAKKQDGDPKVAVLWIKGPECVGAVSTRLNQSVVIFECFWVSFMNT